MVDFIGIGAARAGSSWLWKQLRAHEEIWMPPIKELHYFDRNPAYPSPSYLYPDSTIERLLGQETHSSQYFRRLMQELIKDLVWFRLHNLSWTYRYFFKRCDIDWYKSLFEAGKEKLTGEITPAYSILEYKDVLNIQKELGNIKVIFLIRNPIYRAWSHIKYGYKKRGISSLKDIDRIKSLVNKPVQELRSDYLRTYRIWTDVFGEEQVYVGFYDQIQEDPENLLTDVGNFLNLSSPSSLFKPQESQRRINASKSTKIPSEIQLYLARKYIEDLQNLRELFGGYAEQWIEDAESVLRLSDS